MDSFHSSWNTPPPAEVRAQQPCRTAQCCANAELTETGATKNRWVLMQAAEELVVWDHELLFTSVASEINKEMEALQPLEQTDSSAGECSCHFAHVYCLCARLQIAWLSEVLQPVQGTCTLSSEDITIGQSFTPSLIY